MFKTFKKVVYIVLALSAFVSTQAFAVFTVNITQVGPNIIATGSGSLITTGFPAPEGTNNPFDTGIIPQISCLISGTEDLPYDYYRNVITGPSSYGPGPGVAKETPGPGSNGAAIGICGNVVFIPRGYVSGTPLSSSGEWDGRTFADVGMTPGTYTYTINGRDTFVINVGPQATATTTSIPALSEYALMALASLMAMFGAVKMRKQGKL